MQKCSMRKEAHGHVQVIKLNCFLPHKGSISNVIKLIHVPSVNNAHICSPLQFF